MTNNLPVPFSADLADYVANRDGALDDQTDPWAHAHAARNLWLNNPRFAAGTRDQYLRIFTSWITWVHGSGKTLYEMRRRHLQDYTSYLLKTGNPAVEDERRKPLSRRSVARHMAAISSFYKRAITEGWTETNPVPPSDRPKIRQDSRQPRLAPDDLRRLIATADADSPRSSALVALLALACLRVSEALSARIEDTTHEAGYHFLWTTRKGSKGEKVLLAPEVWQRLTPVFDGRREGTIIANHLGRPLDRKAAWLLVRQLGVDAKIETKIGPHTLRHAYITRGFEMKIPVADLQVAAGHESVDTTRGYDRSVFDPDRHPSIKIAKDLTTPPEVEAPEFSNGGS